MATVLHMKVIKFYYWPKDPSFLLLNLTISFNTKYHGNSVAHEGHKILLLTKRSVLLLLNLTISFNIKYHGNSVAHEGH